MFEVGKMSSRNDCVIVGVLEAMTHVMAQANAALLANQNQNGGVGKFQGLGKFQKNNFPIFNSREDMIPMKHKPGFKKLRRFSMACTDAHKVLF